MNNQKQRHPVAVCMDSVIPLLSTLPVPPQQSKDLAPVFNVHNAIRRSVHCISIYMSTFNADSNFVMIRQAAIECRVWINWYMPYLHHHHHLEDEYWFPAYRQVLIDAGVKAKQVNAVFDQWEEDHKELDQREHNMRCDLDTLCTIIDVTRAETLEALVACQRSLNAFAQFIDSHLKSEEEYWVDQFITNNRITDKKAKELGETFAKTKLKKMKPKELGYLLAFCMSPLGREQEQAVLKTLLPFPVRCYYNWFARKSYLKDAPRLYLIAHGHATA